MSHLKKDDELIAKEMFLEDLEKWLKEYIWEQEKDVVLAPEVGDLKEMLQTDVKAEEEAIALYKQTIKVAGKEGDSTTRRLFEEILSAEEEHHDTFTKLLEK